MKKGFIHLIGMSDEGACMITYDLIGNTPLVLLEHYSDDKVKIYAKLEQWNPGGSVKDRLGKYFSRDGNSRRACACRLNYC